MDIDLSIKSEALAFFSRKVLTCSVKIATSRSVCLPAVCATELSLETVSSKIPSSLKICCFKSDIANSVNYFFYAFNTKMWYNVQAVVREIEFMKTKIIYISGSEIFDVADVRAAFDEVRNALGFGPDTVLFGVPIDSDDLGLENKNPENVSEVPEAQPVIEEIIEEVVTEPEPIKKKTSKSKPETKITVQETREVPEKIIPILSVLSGKKDEAPIIAEESIEISEPEDIEQPKIHETELKSVTVETITIQNPDFLDDEEEILSAQTVTIEEMITDEVPVAQQHKTLEQLFERIAPLRETEEFINITNEEPKEEVNLDFTLEQLATEFAEKEDKIVNTTKSESSGKIGKLKNILPFKKAKREEPSLMGDLFGWAGIAANDDEFSIPGFFTTSASKK
ncbi:MAG: hypothetical protein JXL97_14500 [Bacteroidales bacterium]|nr:hypothetical protein [Bacteroidales bacterium]